MEFLLGDFEIIFDDIDNLNISTDMDGCILPDAIEQYGPLVYHEGT